MIFLNIVNILGRDVVKLNKQIKKKTHWYLSNPKAYSGHTVLVFPVTLIRFQK